jgi:hypothetical protein
MSTPEDPFVLVDTITVLPGPVDGRVLVAGSHGGLYPGYLAASAGVRAVVFNDASIGKESAGVEGLDYLERLGIAAAAVAHSSCRIGDADDAMRRGIVTVVNPRARSVGVEQGMTCAAAVVCLRRALQAAIPRVSAVGEHRTVLGGTLRPVVLVDSASLVDRTQDRGAIVVAGSHGALIGGNPAKALAADAFAAVFNDAGMGIERIGISRLPALDERGIAALTVTAASARIGNGRSSYADGIVSAVNRTAARLGAEVGEPARSIIDRWAGAAPTAAVSWSR